MTGKQEIEVKTVDLQLAWLGGRACGLGAGLGRQLGSPAAQHRAVSKALTALSGVVRAVNIQLRARREIVADGSGHGVMGRW
ncbi:hypothetical protein [Nonomuraea sp. CA-141351]|uniref:hypothetical protein n=1 Tax=Nonomuraea sp. CA-141351 TaxID=3239996 RepID=UPI003D945EF8